MDRNVVWSYEEALSVSSQVVKGCLSASEVVEKNESAGAAAAAI